MLNRKVTSYEIDIGLYAKVWTLTFARMKSAQQEEKSQKKVVKIGVAKAFTG